MITHPLKTKIERAAYWAMCLSEAQAGRLLARNPVWVRVEDEYGPKRAADLLKTAHADALKRVVNQGVDISVSIWDAAWTLADKTPREHAGYSHHDLRSG